MTYPPEDRLLPETLSIALTCTNHHLPLGLKIGDISQPTATSPDRMAFRNIRPLTAPLDPPLGESLLWRLIAHVSLNFLSLADAGNPRALLGIYIFSERNEESRDAANRRRIDGIAAVEVRPATRLVGRNSLMRGQQIVLKRRPDHYAGALDMYLFGSVVERFLADYAPINLFTRLEMVDLSSGESFQWPPRSATKSCPDPGAARRRRAFFLLPGGAPVAGLRRRPGASAALAHQAQAVARFPDTDIDRIRQLPDGGHEIHRQFLRPVRRCLAAADVLHGRSVRGGARGAARHPRLSTSSISRSTGC